MNPKLNKCICMFVFKVIEKTIKLVLQQFACHCRVIDARKVGGELTAGN